MAEHISLEAALAELAADPIGVLRASGVRGTAKLCDGCPVAEFLRRRTGRLVVVLSGRVKFVGSRTRHSMPTPVIQAIRAIDAGEHPELCR